MAAGLLWRTTEEIEDMYGHYYKQQEKPMLTYKSITRKQFNEATQKFTKHHENGVRRTKGDYLYFGLNNFDCALCGKFNFDADNRCESNKLCPLYESLNAKICCAEWRAALNAQVKDEDFEVFHDAEIALVKRLKSIDYDVWLAEKRKGEVTGLFKDYKYTGEYRLPQKGEYYQAVSSGPVNQAEFDFNLDRCHIVYSVKSNLINCKPDDFYPWGPWQYDNPLARAAAMQQQTTTMGVALGIRAQERIQQVLPNSNDCRTCEHDYEPVGKKSKKVKKAEPEVFEARLFEAERQSIRPQSAGKFRFKIISKIAIPKKGDMYCESFAIDEIYIAEHNLSYKQTIVDFADESERQRYYALKYTREIDGVKFRLYEDKYHDIIWYCKFGENKYEDCFLTGIKEIDKIFYDKLNIPIMPYSESHGNFMYP